MTGRFFILATLLIAGCTAESDAPNIAIKDAWARASLAGQTSAAAYMTIRNDGGADRLVAVTTPAAKASLHSSSSQGGVVRMRSVEALEIPARSTVTLGPGSTHVMLTGMAEPLAAGGKLPLELRFQRSGARSISAEVRPASGAAM